MYMLTRPNIKLQVFCYLDALKGGFAIEVTSWSSGLGQPEPPLVYGEKK